MREFYDVCQKGKLVQQLLYFDKKLQKKKNSIWNVIIKIKTEIEM